MGCDSSVRASTVQLLVLCLWLQHISVSLSAPSAISSRNSNGINDNNNNNRNRNLKDSASGDDDRDEDRVVNLLRITRDDRSQQQRRKYEDYSDDVVSI